MSLPPLFLLVLHAMTLPDPDPRSVIDSPCAAVQRRLPGMSGSLVAAALAELNALGLTAVPSITGRTTPAVTADPRGWITDKGWEALGMEAIAPETR
ncbi:MAG TPA: hypothetical protein VMT45_06480 [Thermoanaerobaculaceae bacterium]|nr:hypothetical protein [Thermoanaerobaculaceae bacterium]